MLGCDFDLDYGFDSGFCLDSSKYYAIAILMLIEE